MATIKDKIILITGSTDGIGKQTAIDLAEMGAHVILHGRNVEKAKETVQELIKILEIITLILLQLIYPRSAKSGKWLKI